MLLFSGHSRPDPRNACALAVAGADAGPRQKMRMSFHAPSSRASPFRAPRLIVAGRARHGGFLDSTHLSRLASAGTLLAAITSSLLVIPERADAQGFTVGIQFGLATGSSACWVAIGDVSGDGMPDLAVANAGSAHAPP